MARSPSLRTLYRALRHRATRTLKLLASLTLYPLSGLSARSSGRWVFGYTGEAFADNPKYLYLWMRLHRPDIRVTWITGSKRTLAALRRHKLPARLRWSLPGMLAVLRARVIVFSHGLSNVNTALSRGAFLVNLWHGVGLKTVHLGHAGGNTAAARHRARGAVGRLLETEYLRPYDVLVTTSDAMQRHFAGQFELPPERCPQLGYPRLDCAADPALCEAAKAIDHAAGFELNPGGFREIYIYLPTYRDTGRDFFDQALPDLGRLSAALQARDALLYIKPHPRTQMSIPPRFRNIVKWPDGIDFNTYLADFDVLITDYSSVLYDFLLHKGNGVILYTFDIDEYMAKDRGLVMPFDENVTGLRVDDFDTLCRAIEDGDAIRLDDRLQVERLRHKFWGGSMVPASPAIVDYVLQMLGG